MLVVLSRIEPFLYHVISEAGRPAAEQVNTAGSFSLTVMVVFMSGVTVRIIGTTVMGRERGRNGCGEGRVSN